MRVFIATSRPIGKKCIEWAKSNTPEGFEIVDTMNHCDIFISVLFDKIIPHEFIRGLHGAFNFHPGRLPEYRGAATYSWAIINGESHVGVTLHKIDEGIDSGDVISIQGFTISERDTAETVFTKAEEVIFEMFKEWYGKLLVGKFVAVPQEEAKARIYYRKDLDKIKDLSRFVRALHFPGKDTCFYYDKNGDKHNLLYEKTTNNQ
jgi:methionyl-tRNA formyltransferase